MSSAEVSVPTVIDAADLLDTKLSIELLLYWQTNKFAGDIYTKIVEIVNEINMDKKNVITREMRVCGDSLFRKNQVESIINDFDIGRELSMTPDTEKYIKHILMMKLHYFPNMPWKFCVMKSYFNKEYMEIKYSVFSEFEIEYSSFMTELFDRLIEPPRWFAAMDVARRHAESGVRR